VLTVWGVVATSLMVIFFFDNMKCRTKLHDYQELLNKREEELQKIIKAQAAPQSDSKTEELFEGYVQRKEQQVSGRKVTSISITDKIPSFQTIGQATSFAMGLLEPMTDPTVTNLSGYGNVARTDDFLALKMILKEVVRQIVMLDNNDTKEIIKNGSTL